MAKDNFLAKSFYSPPHQQKLYDKISEDNVSRIASSSGFSIRIPGIYGICRAKLYKTPPIEARPSV
jgi:hypothetical protein